MKYSGVPLQILSFIDFGSDFYRSADLKTSSS